ncbi:MAG: NUDIX hydrolase [Candidatus Marinimicrobia bacterium]|nr:NUDIX hydrolase [Candidatus Neomarinimicrobiota bacterium]
MKKLYEEQVNSKKIFTGKLLDVYIDEVRLPDGRQAAREYIKHPGASVVIPYLGDKKIVFVRQYRYPVREVTIELPAGKIDPGENPEETIRRELIEETGYKIGELRYIFYFYPSVGYTNEKLYIFWADNLEYIGQRPDSDENIQVLKIDLDSVVEMIFDGKIKDSKTIIGVFIAEYLLENEQLREKYNIKI